MNKSVKSIQYLFTYRMPVIKLAVKELKSTKFYAIFLILTMLVGIFTLSPVISSLMNDVVIRSTGRISTVAYARSGSAKDIQAVADQVAAAGGIGNVYIPAGTFNFVEIGESWMTVDVPAGMSLFGAPTERDADGQIGRAHV